MSVSLAAIAKRVAQYSGLGRTGTADTGGDTTTLIDEMIASYAEDVQEGEVVYEARPKLATVTTTGLVAFVEGTPDTITGTGLFGEFAVGDIIEVSGSDKNDGLYTLAVVAANTLTVGAADLVTETADSTITISVRGRGYSGWATVFDKTTGTITVSPAKGETWAEGDEYGLWNKVVGSYARVVEAIGQALTERCFYTARVPLGLLADGDCQAVAGWSINGDPTVAVTAQAYPYRFGRYYITFTASADGGASDYMYQELAVTPSKTYELAVLVRVDENTTGEVVVYDLVNSAELTLTGDTMTITGLQGSGSDWELLRCTFLPPSTCDRVSVRIDNDTHSKATLVSFVAAWPQGARALPIPNRVRSENHVGKVFRWDDKADPAGPETWEPVEYLDAWPEDGDFGGLRMGFNFVLGSNGPYFYQEKTFFERIYSDADTTDCDLEWLAREATLELATEIATRLTVAPGSEEVENWKELELRALYNARRVRRAIVPDGGVISRRARR